MNKTPNLTVIKAQVSNEMEDIEQTTHATEQHTAPSDETQNAKQTQGDGGSEVELTEEQKQAESAKKAEETRAAEQQSAIDRRFAKLTWEKNEAIREAQALREKYVAQEQKSLVEPEVHDYESIDDFKKALSDFYKTQTAQDYQSQFENQRQQQVRQAQQIKLESAEVEFEKAHPDFTQRVSTLVQLSGGELPQQLNIAALDLGEDAPAVFYEICKDPADVINLLEMTPNQQLMKLGEVRATLKNSPKTPKIPNIPPPINPANGKPSNGKKNPLSMSDTEATAYIKSLRKGK